MISASWLKARQPHWSRLELMLSQVQREGLKSLNRTELRDLGLLYRQVSTDLSTVRGDPASSQQARYLNQLLGRAHNSIYIGRKRSLSTVLEFYWRTYPRIFRRLLPFTLTATALFAAGAVGGAFVTLSHPDFMRSFLGPQMVDTIERHEMWTHSILSIKPQASSQIMTNNMSVAFTTFAAGITAGIGTIYLLFFNGVMLGVIASACWLSGMSLQLWSFVASHGVLELPAIFIAGGAGLRLAQALLFPGLLSRRDSLASGGNESVQLLVGVIPMLFVAGLIEAFISPSALPVSLKFSLGAILFLSLLSYLARGFTLTPGSAP
jgi:uncharacterized membrane protein SpoIIM required for sporulation